MKNKYFANLNKIEFVVTDACTGRCKHCSEGDHAACGERIDPQTAFNAVMSVAVEYDIKTVMAFGGEPLLCTDAVYAIMTAARDSGVPRRQVITNGYFSKDVEYISSVARQLADCGVNDLLLSVDAFHQETIPLDTVKIFAAEALKCGIPMRLSPAWLVSREDDNSYNQKTREILNELAELAIPVGEGNLVFPEGNALRYLAEYFAAGAPENPYVDDSEDIRCLSFSANGDVLDGNVYQRDIMQILNDYAPR